MPTLKPSNGTVSSGAGAYIFERRTFAEDSVTSHSDYTRNSAVSTFGGETDLWNETIADPWAVDDVNSEDFGVAFRFQPTTGATVTVESVCVTVYYELTNSKGTIDNAMPDSFRGVTSKGPLRVTVGRNGEIWTANDPEGSWTQRTSNTTQDLYAVDYKRGLYTAVGANGTIVTSADGITWAVQSTDSVQDFYAVFTDDDTTMVGGTNLELLVGSSVANLSTGREYVDRYIDPEA
jgi:hypothetical protein